MGIIGLKGAYAVERLQKVMAQAGLGSRRSCEEMIKDNRVTVNGKPAVLGQKVDPTQDSILVDGKPLGRREAKRYFILNKPRGYVTTSKDQFSRRSVLELVPVAERIYPVGRLDYDSEGLVLLTNDGALAYRVMHPKFELPKTYRVRVNGEITMDAVYRLRTGVTLEDGPTAPAQVELLKVDGGSSVIRITITEGRNRQVRRMCAALGYEVLRLTREAIGPLNLRGLAAGEYRPLRPQEIKRLFEAVGL
ncbi:pseudouridine synthase [Candidatus Darwinibacter acetoxidans]